MSIFNRMKCIPREGIDVQDLMEELNKYPPSYPVYIGYSHNNQQNGKSPKVIKQGIAQGPNGMCGCVDIEIGDIS